MMGLNSIIEGRIGRKDNVPEYLANITFYATIIICVVLMEILCLFNLFNDYRFTSYGYGVLIFWIIFMLAIFGVVGAGVGLFFGSLIKDFVYWLVGCLIKEFTEAQVEHKKIKKNLEEGKNLPESWAGISMLLCTITGAILSVLYWLSISASVFLKYPNSTVIELVIGIIIVIIFAVIGGAIVGSIIGAIIGVFVSFFEYAQY